MSVKKMISCDRCGKEISTTLFRKQRGFAYYIRKFSRNSSEFFRSDIDLCTDCSEEFMRFMRGKKVEE